MAVYGAVFSCEVSMQRSAEHEAAAADAARTFLHRTGLGENAPLADTAIVLGTGWGRKLVLQRERPLPLKFLPGFEGLGMLKGHDRVLRSGVLDGRPVLVVDGRVHLNE